MSCINTCRRVAGRMAHCGVCHRTFSGITGFDGHRVRGVCVDPATRNMRDASGVWRSKDVHPLSRRRSEAQTA